MTQADQTQTQRSQPNSGKMALHFGAGNIGRGFIGALLSQSGYRVVFADINEQVITALREQGEYDIHILDQNARTERISGVSGVLSNGPEIVPAIAEADLITTAVGPNVLRIIAPTLARGIEARAAAGGGPLNIVACENKVGASSFLRDEVLGHISEEGRAYLEQNVGFPNASVDRIVPPFEGEHLLDVGVEEFHEWYVEGPGFRGEIPQIEGMKVTDDLMAYVQRKLYTLNTGHAIAAYLGQLRGLDTVAAAMQDEQTAQEVRAAMQQSGAALVQTHGFGAQEHAEYIGRIEQRFTNPYIHDEVTRVGREPVRKLGPKERLIGPAQMAKELGLPVDALLRGAAAALYFRSAEDPQAQELQTMLAQDGLAATITALTELPEGDPMHAEIVRQYAELSH
ncbi:mannitol-1-phosphate 5-dehydrogenase [Deinococcus piscis]|uniref:Mannitol-1-phosphate 5-dehydrogenase n=1 Tax=Deinococcus piscis TaxID=394230 RepID=A0ABQ3K3H5_9DEIO|nr:mannitol-1-phosphate 5-dehydrogenase [Deinococcus piscis]GHG02388.1 mannitol-1-phosphate 5-dehydrogenase [Deinococcus piscis]